MIPNEETVPARLFGIERECYQALPCETENASNTMAFYNSFDDR